MFTERLAVALLVFLGFAITKGNADDVAQSNTCPSSAPRVVVQLPEWLPPQPGLLNAFLRTSAVSDSVAIIRRSGNSSIVELRCMQSGHLLELLADIPRNIVLLPDSAGIAFASDQGIIRRSFQSHNTETLVAEQAAMVAFHPGGRYLGIFRMENIAGSSVKEAKLLVWDRDEAQVVSDTITPVLNPLAIVWSGDNLHLEGQGRGFNFRRVTGHHWMTEIDLSNGET